MSLRKLSFDDVFEFANGKALTQELVGDLVPAYGANGPIGMARKANHSNAIVLGRVGANCGSVAYCQSDFWATDNTIVIYAKEGHHIGYLNYFLRNMELNRFSGGSAQPLLTQRILKPLPAHVHDLEDQERVCSVLSSYDHLIATNTRRIALLEEAARRLHHEWFVHLRFPGYETVKVIDGVPEDWRIEPIGELFEYHIGGGWGKEESDGIATDEGYVIRGTDIDKVRGGTVSSVPLRYHPTKNLASRRLQAGDLIFEVSGGSRDQGVGRLLPVTAHLLDEFDRPVMCASFCKLIRPASGTSEYLAFTINYLRRNDGLRAFENQSASNIVNFAFTEFCERQMVYRPSESILLAFKSAVRPYWEQIAVLGKQQGILAQARDALLPKLMSGQLDVSNVSIQDIAQGA